MLKSSKKIILRLLILGVMGVATLLLVNFYLLHTTAPLIKSKWQKLKPAEAAIILGAKVYNDNIISTILNDRMRKGAELYLKGKVKKLLVSGDHGQHDYDEVNAVKHHLLKMGVPARDIFTDHAGFSTYDSLYRASAVFQVSSAIVVTQEFHLPRAIYLGLKKGIDVQGYRADRRIYRGRYYNALRESIARLKDFFKINFFAPEPTFLGEVLPITGDGRATEG